MAKKKSSPVTLEILQEEALDALQTEEGKAEEVQENLESSNTENVSELPDAALQDESFDILSINECSTGEEVAEINAEVEENAVLENTVPESSLAEGESEDAVFPLEEDAPADEALSLELTLSEAAPLAEMNPVYNESETYWNDSDDSESGGIRNEMMESPESLPEKRGSERQSFFDLDFNDLDRDLTVEERNEWNAVYASYRGRSALNGTIIGVDRHSINARDVKTGELRQDDMYCAIVIPYRVRIVIPVTEMWEEGHERPDFVLQNMVGSTIDFIIIKVDREAGFAIASRRMAAKARRFYFSRRPALHSKGAKIKCRVLAVGPRRCLVECFGHDINLTQRELRYAAIPDLRSEYRPGQELECVVKQYDPEEETLRISVKDMYSNPFDGAIDRHPPGCRRQATISGKYGGGVFCNLPDGTVCMCSYAYQYDDSQFQIGDSVIVVIQRYDMQKKQIYGKIISKW